MSWVHLRASVLLEFADAQRSGSGFGRSLRYEAALLVAAKVLLRDEHLTGRRAEYALHRREMTEWYLETLERGRERSRRWWSENKSLVLARESHENMMRRMDRVAGRMCENCGSPVSERDSRSGPTPKYCSRICARRAASRAWWHRNKTKS